MPADDDPPRARVIGLTQHRGYRPDLAALARDQVVSAREKLGLDREEFAALLEPLLGWRPSADVVEGWETQATPPGDVILAAGLAIQRTPSEVLTVGLSPNADKVIGLVSSVIGEAERLAGSPDVVRAYGMRGLIGRSTWNEIIREAKSCLWLYGMAEMGYALDDETPSIIRAGASRGCDIRVLLLDPDYAGITDIDEDEGNPPGTLAPRIRAARSRFCAMRDQNGKNMQVRLYNAPPTVSVVRADDRMLVTPYMRFFAGSNSPTFELFRTADGHVFDRYARHFNNTWNLARESA